MRRCDFQRGGRGAFAFAGVAWSCCDSLTSPPAGLFGRYWLLSTRFTSVTVAPPPGTVLFRNRFPWFPHGVACSQLRNIRRSSTPTWPLKSLRIGFPVLLRLLRFRVSSAARLGLSPRRVSRASGALSWTFPPPTIIASTMVSLASSSPSATFLLTRPSPSLGVVLGPSQGGIFIR